MSGLALPITPENLVVPNGRLVESDTYHICERIRKEVSPNLLIYEQPMEDGGVRYGVVEKCADGVERFTFWHNGELDARVIMKLQYMLHVPFEHRLEEAERLEAQWEKERKQAEIDQVVETVGLPMLPDLERTGFIQRSKSYPKIPRRRYK